MAVLLVIDPDPFTPLAEKLEHDLRKLYKDVLKFWKREVADVPDSPKVPALFFSPPCAVRSVSSEQRENVGLRLFIGHTHVARRRLL